MMDKLTHRPSRPDGTSTTPISNNSRSSALSEVRLVSTPPPPVSGAWYISCNSRNGWNYSAWVLKHHNYHCQVSHEYPVTISFPKVLRSTPEYRKSFVQRSGTGILLFMKGSPILVFPMQLFQMPFATLRLSVVGAFLAKTDVKNACVLWIIVY